MNEAQINEEILNKKLERFIAIFGRKCEKILKYIDNDIAKLFAKYGIDGGMTFQEAFEYLTDNERLEFQEDLNDYLEKVFDKAYLKNHELEMSALGLRARIRRNDFIKASILMNVDKFFMEFLQESKQLLGELGSEAFVKKVVEIVKEMPTPKDVKPTVKLVDNNTTKTTIEKAIENTKGVEINTSNVVGGENSGGASVTIEKTGEEINLLSDKLENFGITNPNIMEEMLEYPWSGKSFSDKVWDNCDNLIKVLDEKLTLGLVTGKPYSQIVNDLSKELNVEKWKIERLVRTEAAFINNQAQLSAYYKSGIKYYRYLARIDERTSPECKEHNGKIYETEKAVAGDNFPPLHCYCRSVTQAVFLKPGEKVVDNQIVKSNKEKEEKKSSEGDTDKKDFKILKSGKYSNFNDGTFDSELKSINNDSKGFKKEVLSDTKIDDGVLYKRANKNNDVDKNGKTSHNILADPIYVILGSITKSHPLVMERILSILKDNKVKISYRDGQYAYSLANKNNIMLSESDKCPVFIIDKKASVGAWLHEYRHFLDDKKAGFQDFSYVLSNPDLRWEREKRAYELEISIARHYKNDWAVKQLEKKMYEEYERIYGRKYIHTNK